MMCVCDSDRIPATTGTDRKTKEGASKGNVIPFIPGWYS